jgi:hypothetical protein
MRLRDTKNGEAVDVHALRHTFGTLLSKGGVAPRTAQSAMRHSDMRLTMNVYTDPRLLDIAGAVDALPMLSIDARSAPTEAIELKATGTEPGRSSVAPMVAPTGVVLGQKGSISDSFVMKRATDLKTKKPLESLRKPRVFSSRGERIRTFDPLVPNQMR